MRVPHGHGGGTDRDLALALPWPPRPHPGPTLGLWGFPGPWPSWCGTAGGDVFCSLCSCSRWDCTVFTTFRSRRRCEVFQDVTVLPAKFSSSFRL